MKKLNELTFEELKRANLCCGNGTCYGCPLNFTNSECGRLGEATAAELDRLSDALNDREAEICELHGRFDALWRAVI